jgi:hypothetical protein
LIAVVAVELELGGHGGAHPPLMRWIGAEELIGT